MKGAVERLGRLQARLPGTARKQVEFEAETLEFVFDMLISGGKLPEAFREHRLRKRSANWAGFTECHLGADLNLSIAG